MQHIPVIQDGELFYLRIGDAVFWHRAAIRAHPLSRVAIPRARDAFKRFFTSTFPDAEIEWVNSVWAADASEQTLCSLDFRNDLEGRASSHKCLYADEISHGEHDDHRISNRTRGARRSQP
jgi:hypothetical protein